jgi:hypothetical protein
MTWNGDRPKRYDLSPLLFVISAHVEERWLERVGEPFDRERIRQEVFDSVYHGRFWPTKPGWLGSHPSRKAQGYVYTWPPHYRYAYLVRFGGDRPGQFLVRTVLVPILPEERSLRRQLLAWLRKQDEAGAGSAG